MVVVIGAVSASATEPLTIATWGGSYEAVQHEVLFEPFTQQTGIGIETVAYNGGAEILDEEVDVIDMGVGEAMAACRAGRLRWLDAADLPDSPDGRPARADFIDGAIRPCSLTHTVYATVVAYDSRAFGGRRPSRIGDLFDLDAFPGKRALHPSPEVNLEWAMLALGVPRREVYDLLSTERGITLALQQLDRLEGSLAWWRDGETPVKWLERGEVVMATGYNGRFFNARLDPDSPIEILWHGQVREQQAWVVAGGSGRAEDAVAFIHFATRTEPLARLAERLAYGPARESAMRRVGRHPQTGTDMQPHLPTHPYNSAFALDKDVAWYASTLERIRERFERWRAD